MASFVAMKNPSRITIPMEPQPEAPTPPLPHFDDEATLLTARPVVPIDIAAAQETTHGYLFKAGIILAAALLGAGVAVSVVFFQNRRAAPATAVAEFPAPATLVVDSENTSKPIARQSEETVASASTTKPTSTEDESDLSDIAPIPAKEITPLNGRERSKQRSADDEAAARQQKVVMKRSDRPAQRQQAAKVQRPNDSDPVVERPRNAGRIREIFEGPSPF